MITHIHVADGVSADNGIIPLCTWSKQVATQNETLLELRLGELELEVIRLRRQVQKLEATPQQQPAPPPAKSYTPPAERTELHERRTYAFEAKLPPIRRIVDFRSHNTHTNEVVHVDDFSAPQLERALQKFARLQFVSRRHWHGDKRLYSVCRKLFAQRGAIQRHAGSCKWTWHAWPHERHTHAAQIVQALSRQKQP